jgi:hypothetical protein
MYLLLLQMVILGYLYFYLYFSLLVSFLDFLVVLAFLNSELCILLGRYSTT